MLDNMKLTIMKNEPKVTVYRTGVAILYKA